MYFLDNTNLRIIIVVFFSLFLFSCKNTPYEGTTNRFLNYVKNEKYDEAKSLLSKGYVSVVGDEGANWRLKNAHDLLDKYGTPSAEKWEIKYDTGREKGIFRMIIVTIPVYKAKEPANNGDLEWGNIELYYACEMPYSAEGIFSFDTDIKKKHGKLY